MPGTWYASGSSGLQPIVIVDLDGRHFAAGGEFEQNHGAIGISDLAAAHRLRCIPRWWARRAAAPSAPDRQCAWPSCRSGRCRNRESRASCRARNRSCKDAWWRRRARHPSPGSQGRILPGAVACRPVGCVPGVVEMCASSNIADRAGPDDLRGHAIAFVGEALVAHLGGNLVLHRRLLEQARLPRSARQRLLAVDVLAALHAMQGHRGMHEVGDADGARVDVFLLVEHDAEIFIFGELFELLHVRRGAVGDRHRTAPRCSRCARLRSSRRRPGRRSRWPRRSVCRRKAYSRARGAMARCRSRPAGTAPASSAPKKKWRSESAHIDVPPSTNRPGQNSILTLS